ncbi:alkaline phosphatase D family protein [Brevundimonas vitis]|uniref:Alkaline phosphatase D family protein n=1 Tax=Brevundimonas vitisensis TaxID=2800818 RepID=A0ABX7BPG5_9CAUL|nr:alkaline phosphatase D family protein [Brevundimonas vitisensis]QQQ19482.1 alkaline phosphatase D family protein [Brevundimonas vitisensis]
MKLDRRGLIGLLGGGVAAPALARPGAKAATVQFRHGVASGDPTSDGMVLWTRLTTDAAEPLSVDWFVRPAQADTAPVLSGRIETGPDRDWTVKIEVSGLESGREYRFDFAAAGTVSPQGLTRTLPAGTTPVVSLAVVSCQLYPGGLFNAYQAIADLPRVDAVVHLGDYIYEYGAEADDYGMATGQALGRIPEPAHEIVTLADYRLRHAQYKSDPDLQAAHARAPFICVWDDHEVTNDAWQAGAQNHQPASEGDYAARKAIALRAYYEWMPIREPRQGAMREAIQRSFHFGDLASLHMVETRLLARTEQLSYQADLTMTVDADGTPVPDIAAFEAKRKDPARDLLGEDQRAWLGRELSASHAAGRPWQVLGNQVVMARVAGPDVSKMDGPAQIEAMIAALPAEVQAEVRLSIQLFKAGLPFNLDAWDGYPAGRERLYQVFEAAGVQPIVLAGDSHAFWVNELKDAGGVRRAVEFGTSAVSSPSPGDALPGLPLGPLLSGTNDEVVFCDQTAKGFVLLTLTPEAATAELRTVSTIMAKPFESGTLRRYRIARTPDGLGPLERI